MEVLDNRGLEPPQPMMRTLKNLEKMKNGEQLAIINDRRPMFLYEEPEEMGYLHETEALEDGRFKITITKTGD
jgi:tRNA 2-thiouridine synthesizing protein A